MRTFARHMLCAYVLAAPLAFCQAGAGANLLQNPSFEFHAFGNHREGKAVSHTAHAVAFWQHADYGDITVQRESQLADNQRPPYSTHNIVSIKPGKKFWQFIPLPWAGLAHGESVTLLSGGWQSTSGALRASVSLLKLDSEDGTWKPSDFGCSDQREFPRHSRGELVVARRHEQSSTSVGMIELQLRDILLEGRFHQDNNSHSDDLNTVAIQVEFFNASEDAEVLVWAPSLLRSAQAPERLPGLIASSRPMEPAFRHLPRTMQKLWKGEAIHILLMGSSIDRGSANPPMYLYDENPESPSFKQPLSERVFEPELVNRPDLDGYVGWWQHYFSYAGRLRLELMRNFDLPVEKICLNFMACDGSCIGEATSGLAEYCSLSIAPQPGDNGYKAGGDWQTLHPELFTRPGGPGPDLVIFGSGANEKTDTPDEIAPLEGSIRWIQRHYPNAEFLFCMFQNKGGYTPNPGDLQALALRYQIPFMDYGKLGDDLTRWCNRYALVPRDGHPQAAAHEMWFQTLAQAFICWDPVPAGIAQLRLPERIHPNTIGWEGEIKTFLAESPRLKENMTILEDTTVNCWASCAEKTMQARINGQPAVGSLRAGITSRNLRNSAFRWGRGTLGDRHILELIGNEAKLTAADFKVPVNRRFFPASHPQMQPANLTPESWTSSWGAPYGEEVRLLQPGQTVTLTAAATDLSVAYLDHPEGGVLRALVNDQEMLRLNTNEPFTDQTEQQHFLENRRGIRGLPFGLHVLTIIAEDKPVRLLGVFTYDTRANTLGERRLTGLANGGETVFFEPPFRARPVVICGNGLQVAAENITPSKVTFQGETGAFVAIGE